LMVLPHAPELVVNQDRLDLLHRSLAHETPLSLLRKMAAIDAADKHLKANVNPRLTLEILFMTLAETNNP
jgi:hypothetical protein